jgi:plasmid stability protein
MSSITIRNLDDGVKRRLRLRAAQHNRSMEEEARDILRCALAQEVEPSEHRVNKVRRRVETFGGVDLELPPRGPIRNRRTSRDRPRHQCGV